MELWKWLYALVWITFLQFILILPFGLLAGLADAHVVVGIAVLAVAHRNAAALRKTNAPGRIKRTARASAYLATAQIILGLILYVGLMLGVGLVAGTLAYEIILHLHRVVALAIITQAASVATAYDMWEEKEFLPSSVANGY